MVAGGGAALLAFGGYDGARYSVRRRACRAARRRAPVDDQDQDVSPVGLSEGSPRRRRGSDEARVRPARVPASRRAASRHAASRGGGGRESRRRGLRHRAPRRGAAEALAEARRLLAEERLEVFPPGGEPGGDQAAARPADAEGGRGGLKRDELAARGAELMSSASPPRRAKGIWGFSRATPRSTGGRTRRRRPRDGASRRVPGTRLSRLRCTIDPDRPLVEKHTRFGRAGRSPRISITRVSAPSPLL